mmetsp:Transcript_9418/g.23861  ORF Transcript_9418/g.23861 Transcript_9418/m.23861 type:complete len:148 (+) Transcript_9418:631-1074(+)
MLSTTKRSWSVNLGASARKAPGTSPPLRPTLKARVRAASRESASAPLTMSSLSMGWDGEDGGNGVLKCVSLDGWVVGNFSHQEEVAEDLAVLRENESQRFAHAACDLGRRKRAWVVDRCVHNRRPRRRGDGAGGCSQRRGEGGGLLR